MQYTLQEVPPELDRVLRQRAAAEGKTVDRFVVEHLQQTLGVAQFERPTPPGKKRDLSDLAGTWVDDPVFEEVRADFERIDPELWK